MSPLRITAAFGVVIVHALAVLILIDAFGYARWLNFVILYVGAGMGAVMAARILNIWSPSER